MNTELETEQTTRRRFSGLQVFGMILGAMLITALVMFFVLKAYFFPKEFRPVTLNAREEQVLEEKLERLEGVSLPAQQSDRRHSDPQAPAGDRSQGPLEPEAYSEDDAKREINLSEKELNALLARNTNLANRLAVDLSDNLASAKLLVPLDPDFPIMGGKTLKVNAGVEMSFEQGRPVVVLRGVSVMGVPVPNAWLGNLKNVDLVSQFGADDGFWKAFAAGVEMIQVEDGQLMIKLKE